jgi:aluminum resistance protein
MMAYSYTTEALYSGEHVRGMDMTPETIPCFMTTAFTMRGFKEVQETYATKGYTYVRTRNPNRTALGEVISCLEGGESTLIFSSGMGAITSTLMTLLSHGDHVICNSNIYGETYCVMTEILSKCGIDVTFVDYQNTEDIAKAVRPETKLIYSEVLSNPTLTLVDLKAVAEIAHKNGAYLMVDNTFTTPIAIRPIDFGADIVINSLTKFLNGHSDAIGGSITTTQALCDKIQPVAMLLGTPGDPFSSWLIHRGINTASVRMPQAMHTAEKLAATLAANKHVSRVNHPSLPTYPQKELADRMFGKNGYCAMLSFIVPEDLEKIDQFMLALKFPKYAPTLGGLHTTLSHPVTSSHMGVPDETRRKMGITPGMIRVSVGIEDADDLAADFENALKVFD